MNEKGESDEMPMVGFGERHGFSHQAAQAPAQGAVKAFDMVGVGFGGTLSELFFGNDLRIRLPDVGEAVRRFVRSGNRLPQLATCGFAATAHHKSYDLARAAAERDPDPALVFATPHKAPDLIQLQHIAWLGLKVGPQARSLRAILTARTFLSQQVTVCRDTPKVRVKPRKLLRSV